MKRLSILTPFLYLHFKSRGHIFIVNIFFFFFFFFFFFALVESKCRLDNDRMFKMSVQKSLYVLLFLFYRNIESYVIVRPVGPNYEYKF